VNYPRFNGKLRQFVARRDELVITDIRVDETDLLLV
jgi:hypothetical protein